jgi:hypothetical protein
MEEQIRIGRVRSLPVTPRGRSSESQPKIHNIHSKFQFIPALLSADDLPPPLTHDAFLTYQDSLHSLPSSSLPSLIPTALGTAQPLLPFASSLLFYSAQARASLHPSPYRCVSTCSISLSRSLPIQNTCHDSDLTRPSPPSP